MNILIVDDEALSVDGIAKSLDWSALSIEEVYKAYSMTQAQAVFAAHHVDILLCDIEMPRGSGIELMEWIRTQNYSPVCIFLTCYSSFDYASSAVRLQMFDYILKPCEYNKLTEILNRAVEKVREDQIRREKETLGAYWDADYQNRFANFWEGLLQGDISSTESLLQRELSWRHLDLDIMNDQYYLMLIKTISVDQRLDWQDNSWLYAVKNVIAELMLHSTVLSWNALFVAVIPASSYDTPNDVGRAGKHLITTLSGIIPAQFLVYYADPCGILDAAHTMQALRADSMERYCAHNAVIRLNAVFPVREDYAFSEERWLDALLSGHPEVPVNDVHHYLNAPCPSQYITRQQLNSIYHQILKVVYASLERNNLSVQQDFLNQSSSLENDIFYSIRSFCSWMQSTTTKTVELITSKENMSNVVDQVAAYIRANLNNELTRNELTKVAHLHPDYLSTYFKNKMGISLSEYIARERIREAKSLLLSTDLPINEIAMQTGFQNTSYFSKQFKKLEAMTPFQYRKDHRRSLPSTTTEQS